MNYFTYSNVWEYNAVRDDLTSSVLPGLSSRGQCRLPGLLHDHTHTVSRGTAHPAFGRSSCVWPVVLGSGGTGTGQSHAMHYLLCEP